MKDEIINKICLGTVQFGLDYGIVNKTKKIPRQEVFDILSHAEESGINTIDTAYSYGESEQVIGEFLRHHKSNLKIISKFPSLKNKDMCRVKDIFYCSLNRLKLQKIYGYLVHSFNDFLYDASIWEQLVELKDNGIIQKIGFSIYKIEELEILINRKISFNMLQIPYSIFDRRFEIWFPWLKKNAIDVYARSIFLQGLAFLDPEKLPDNLQGAKDYLIALQQLSDKTAIPICAICLNFVLGNPNISKVLVGVGGKEHFKKNIEAVNLLDQVKNIHDKLEILKVSDEELLLPYCWETLSKNKVCK